MSIWGHKPALGPGAIDGQKTGKSPEVPKGPSAQAAVSRQEGRVRVCTCGGWVTGVCGGPDGEAKRKDVESRGSGNQFSEPGCGALRSQGDSQMRWRCPSQR